MVKPFIPKNNSVDAPVHHQTHVAYQTLSQQSPYIQYDRLHEALQADIRKQAVRANQCRIQRIERKPDPTCELGCRESNESTVYLEHCTSETRIPQHSRPVPQVSETPLQQDKGRYKRTIHII
jgi:hypothetical protein